MLSELIEKADKLEAEGKMNPIGYGKYSEPIKWVIHIYPDEDRIEVEEYAGENRPRAKPSTRTGRKVFPCPFADEAGYVLGIPYHEGKKEDKKIDGLAPNKHKAYLNLLGQMAEADQFNDPLLREAIEAIREKLRDGSIMKAFSGKEIYNKTWVTFVYEKGGIRGKHLHELPETNSFWQGKVASEVDSGSVQSCSICGRTLETVKNIPSKITLKSADRQLVSFNENAFVSYSYTDKNVSLGICFLCAEKFSQALNHLLKNNSHSIFEDKSANGKVNNNSSRNQTAVYWLKENTNFSLDSQEFSVADIFSTPLGYSTSIQVQTTEELVDKFLNTPWIGSNSAISIDEDTFYLAILSPNGKGRAALREWLHVSAKEVKKNLMGYFRALALVDSYGGKRRPYTIRQLLEPLGDVDPNMAKTLVRSAYLGQKPPFSLLKSAVRRLRISGARDGSIGADTKQSEGKKSGLKPFEVWQRLCTIIKFCLTFGKEDAQLMEQLNIERNNSAYQAGRLLAVLEEIQRRAAKGRLTSTLVDRYYGSASTAPLTVFPLLISMATKAHMPKIRKDNRGYTGLEDLLEDVMRRIDEAEGFPRTLSLLQQGEFALGFYHQRAYFSANRKKKKEEVIENGTLSQS